ncbi:hypothetical protein DVH24_002032 [Malus domestica]|uniref:RING-type E3 ubiquitin transferase n=1 Tax=Malus domestica TaxID=3750 RepID=A0A498I8L3_MALDO|nr:hypothetical protein DVH24_002032 [Malus domestica]
MGRGQTQKKAGEVVAVAIDNDKGSQHALKWTIDSLVTRGQALTLLQLKCNEVMIEDKNIAKALVNYVVNNSIDILVLGAPSRSGLLSMGEDAVSTTKPAIRSMPPTTNLTAETNIPQMIIRASSGVPISFLQ